VLPTVVSVPQRIRTREDAKKELGIATDSILLLSAARGIKYNTVDGVTFTAPHVELLKKHPKAQLVVLGAGDRPDWAADISAVEGRIRSLPATPDTRAWFEACDIYVDSFPFVSSTSMMEAAGLGAPLVSRFYGPNDALIFAINHPGIDKPTLHAASEAAYVAHLDRLMSDVAFRAAKGEEARLSVLDHHTAPGWNRFLENAYALAETVAPVDPSTVFTDTETDTFSHGEPDRSLYQVFGFGEEPTVRLLRGVAGMLPARERAGVWLQLLHWRGFDGLRDAIRLMFPTWLLRRLLSR
jgi:Glycosyl transferases group 1